MENFEDKNKDLFYYSIVIASDLNYGIGAKTKLPWNIHRDIKHFKFITSYCKNENKKNIVIMGRKTWEAIPKKYQPLPGRINIVFTKSEEFVINNPNIENSFYVVKTFEEYEQIVENFYNKNILNEIFVIGGRLILESFKKQYPDKCKLIFYTLINKIYSECDVFFRIEENEFDNIFISNTFYDEIEKVNYDYRILVNKKLDKKIKIDEVYLDKLPTYEQISKKD